MAARLLVDLSKAPITVLPYATGGTNQAIADILGGRVHVVIESRPGLKGALDSGDLKALAIMSSERVAVDLTLPTAAETVPGLIAVGWTALAAPKGTPEAGFLPIVIWDVAARMLLGPVALGSIAAGVYQMRDRTAPFYRQSLALPLIIAGLCALIWMSQETVGLGHRWFTGRAGPIPQKMEWLRVAAGWLVTAFLWGLGLRLWASWSAARCVMWTAGVLMIPAATLLIYRLVLLTNPPLGA